MIGSRLSHFRLTARLGAGGMGEVYRAEDGRLGREVAVKVLPPTFTSNPDRLARFEREARVLASLSHPAIAGIHEVGHENGVHFLVMELAHGETLAERIARGPVPWDEALNIALQIAQALEAAHERGIVHRDLKPANVMVDAQGRVKVLDFGLAKALAPDPASAAAEPTNSPTLTYPSTQAGMLLGTAAYMSPEQARGQTAGPQADVWSFGVVLWEMLTGRRLFGGDTVSDTLAAVLRQEVDVEDLPSDVPARLRRTLALCLQRDLRRRLRHVGDALLLLTSEEPTAPPPTAAPARRSRWLLGAVVALVTVGLGLSALWWSERSVPRRRLVTSELGPPPGATLRLDLGLALSPDGREVVFAADTNGQRQLWARPLSAAAARPLAGTEGAIYPFWSPDSRHIAFFADDRLKRIAVAGGPPQALCEVQDPRGGSWSESGEIVFASYWRGGLEAIPAAGGPRRTLTTPDAERNELSHRWPWFLPGGRALLFVAQTAEGGTVGDRSSIEHLDLASGERTALVAANSSMAYSPTGHLLYWHGGSLVAHPFDLAERRTTGDYLPLGADVLYTGNEAAVFGMSGEGTLVYGSGRGASTSQLLQLDLAGNRLAEITGAGEYHEPAFSPDGRRLVYGLGGDLWIHDLGAGSATRFTFEEGVEWTPVWSPDGEWLAYATSIGAETIVLARKRSSGSGEPEELLRLEDAAGFAAWSPDGRLVFNRFTPGTDFDLWTLDVETRAVELLLRTPFLDAEADYSPDGRWMAYGSNERGRFEIYVRAVGAEGGRWQVSTAGGEQPRWAPDGRTLYYLSAEGGMMAVPVEPGDTFRPGRPVELFSTPVPLDDVGDVDLHPDGRSFVVNWPLERLEERAVLVQEWPRLLAEGSRR